VPAAISYASSAVLTVQVPFSVQPGKQTEMRVMYQNASSDPVMLDVLNVAPGVYTQSANGEVPLQRSFPMGGSTPCCIRLRKGSSSRSTPPDSEFVNPALATGKVPPSLPLSSTVFPVTAEVDGRSANVSFAGAAPGFPGLYQINLQIRRAPAPEPDRWCLNSEGAFSQFGVAIFVQ
jgi:hypothetical protein